MPDPIPFTLPFGFSAYPCWGCNEHLKGGDKAVNAYNYTWHALCWDRYAAANDVIHYEQRRMKT
jgi:hypothetical protein